VCQDKNVILQAASSFNLQQDTTQNTTHAEREREREKESGKEREPPTLKISF